MMTQEPTPNTPEPEPTNPFDAWPWKPGSENPKDGNGYLIRFKETPQSFYFCKIFWYSPASTIDQIEWLHPHEIVSVARVHDATHGKDAQTDEN